LADGFLFVLSKVAWALLAPGNLLLFLLVLGIGLLLAGRRPAGLWLAGGATGALLALAVLPLGAWLMWSLESRYRLPSDPPDRVDGIIVLGGAVEPLVAADHGQPALNQHGERMLAGVELARRHPGARLVFSGGSGRLLDRDLTEVAVARDIWSRLGLDVGHVLFEDRSRNTWENALYSRDLARPQPGEVWLLVTSAFHMPRAVGVFRAAGWPVVPWPVSYEVSNRELGRLGFDLRTGLELSERSVKEYVGMAAYRLMGRLSVEPDGGGRDHQG